MIAYIHQPEYFPWLGFFDKLSRCDIFVVLDNVQFERGGFQNRNRIRTPEGWLWLTVPVKRRFPQLIREAEISGSDWAQKHLRLIEMYLGESNHFEEYYPILSSLLSSRWDMLEDLTLGTVKRVTRILGIDVPTVRSSTLKARGSLQALLIEICKEVGADCYLAGMGGQTYMNAQEFERNGIKVAWHRYTHPTYAQVYPSFRSNMSVLDLIFNEGGEALKLIRSGGDAT